MWPLCLACIFFHNPQPGDADGVKYAIESFYASARGPWSEVPGPFATVHLYLLAPDRGVADTTLTVVTVCGNPQSSLPCSGFGTQTERRRFSVTRVGGEWRAVNLLPDLR